MKVVNIISLFTIKASNTLNVGCYLIYFYLKSAALPFNKTNCANNCNNTSYFVVSSKTCVCRPNPGVMLLNDSYCDSPCGDDMCGGSTSINVKSRYRISCTNF